MGLRKTIHVQSGHTMAIFKILPGGKHPADASKYTDFYTVRNFDESGVVFFYMAKGYKNAKSEIHIWYPNGQMWSGFGTSFKSAIEGAQRDGWLHTGI